jgi:hypothetical protein
MATRWNGNHRTRCDVRADSAGPKPRVLLSYLTCLSLVGLAW